jgi:hypothetical protein
MFNHDPSDEPVFLDYKDAPDFFEGRYEPQSPPAGMTWWEGRWPTGGVNGPDDLKWYVELALEEMISFQGCESLADLGVGLGNQALKNADRYLGLNGKGDHPPRPPANQLERVEDVEDALEALLRYLRQQGQLAETNGQQTTTSASTSATPRPEKPNWRKADADAAIREYVAKNAHRLAPLRAGAQADQKDAIEAARLIAGRNTISETLGISLGRVSKSPVYLQLRDEFHLERDRSVLDKSKAIGLDIAIEEKGKSEDDPVVEEVARRETADFIRSKLDEEDAQLLIGQLELGKLSAEKAREYAQVMLDNKDDTRTRRKPR